MHIVMCMEANFGIVILFSLIGGVLSLTGGIFLLRKKYTLEALAKYAAPFAAGALLAAVFLDLLPEAQHESTGKEVYVAALVGIIGFFVAERFLRWFHHYHPTEGKEHDPTVGLIIASDTIHNALDGIAIAAAFLVSVPTGIVTTIAVAAHEIPQEIADIGLLLAKGVHRWRVLMINIFSALATTATAVITFALGSDQQLPTSVLLGLSAGFLLYIALSDIVPMIHAKTDASKLLQVQTLLLIIGVAVVGLSVSLAHGYIEENHVSESEKPNHSYHEHEHAN